MLDVLLDAAIDSLKILPVLFAVYLLIEVFEARAQGLNRGLLKGRLSPLLGTAAGTLPQCGFSVVATNLYVKKYVSLGTLLAVYIATSDEAIPILLTSREGFMKLLPLLLIKIFAALFVGYLFLLLSSKTPDEDCGECKAHPEELDCGCACHSHARKTEQGFKHYLVKTLKHTLPIFAFILLINVALGITIYYVTEERLNSFMDGVGYLQPVLAALVGLIPNCASSVAITQMYSQGFLGLGGALAGLTANGGLGYAVLIKQSKNRLKAFGIIGFMFLFAVVLGLSVQLIHG